MKFEIEIFGEIMKDILVTFKWKLKDIVGHRHLMFVTDYSCNEILLTLVSKTVRWKLKFKFLGDYE